MAKIVGIRRSEFKGADGTDVSGMNVYLTYPLDKGEGIGTDRIFITDKKLSGWSYKPHVGDEVEMSYNKYGKVASMDKDIPKQRSSAASSTRFVPRRSMSPKRTLSSSLRI